jgi:MFS family permease
MRLQSGQLLSQLGTSSSTIAYPLLVLALTDSPAKAGVVGFARSVPWALFSLPAGLAADRWNRRWLMIAADGVRVLAIGSLAATILLDRVAFWQISRRVRGGQRHCAVQCSGRRAACRRADTPATGSCNR